MTTLPLVSVSGVVVGINIILMMSSFMIRRPPPNLAMCMTNESTRSIFPHGLHSHSYGGASVPVINGTCIVLCTSRSPLLSVPSQSGRTSPPILFWLPEHYLQNNAERTEAVLNFGLLEQMSSSLDGQGNIPVDSLLRVWQSSGSRQERPSIYYEIASPVRLWRLLTGSRCVNSC